MPGFELDKTEEQEIPTSGSAIRALRTGAGITTRQLAAGAGISHSHLVRFEQGEREVAKLTLARIVAALADLSRGVA